jgi:choline dehydrogenase
MMKTEAEAGLNGRSLVYPRGRIIGGCSSINGMIYMRGQSRDYDHWRQLGNTGWGWDDVLPYFMRSEDNAAGADDLHGEGGEWRVESQRLSWEILDAFHDACLSAGIPATDDFNRGNNEGVGYFKVNQRRGLRWSSATAFLKPALKRRNLKVLTNAQVDSLQMDGRRVTGVHFRHGNVLKSATAEGDTILSAGAIGSPQIMQLSGIGPAALLGRHGITVRHELPGVGSNLQDHLQIRAIYRVGNTVTLNERASSLFGRARIALEYALRRSGPMSMAPSQLGVFTKSDAALDTPDLQYHVQPLSLDAFGQPLHDFPAITASVCNLRPQSRGSVTIRSADPADKPMIQPNYLSTPGDRMVAANSLRLTRRIMAQAPLAPFTPQEYLPGVEFNSDDDLANKAGDIGTTIFHPVGTARMGSDADAVVDDQLRVHGIDGLRVVDASIMPTITSGNTNSPTVMIAEKGADMILKQARSGQR